MLKESQLGSWIRLCCSHQTVLFSIGDIKSTPPLNTQPRLFLEKKKACLRQEQKALCASPPSLVSLSFFLCSQISPALPLNRESVEVFGVEEGRAKMGRSRSRSPDLRRRDRSPKRDRDRDMPVRDKDRLLSLLDKEERKEKHRRRSGSRSPR